MAKGGLCGEAAPCRTQRAFLTEHTPVLETSTQVPKLSPESTWQVSCTLWWNHLFWCLMRIFLRGRMWLFGKGCIRRSFLIPLSPPAAGGDRPPPPPPPPPLPPPPRHLICNTIYLQSRRVTSPHAPIESCPCALRVNPDVWMMIKQAHVGISIYVMNTHSPPRRSR